MNEFERVQAALSFIPVGGHDERVRIAFAVKAALGDDGRGVWDAWRDGRGDDEAAAVWRSAKADGGVSAGTLFHEAKAHGWRDDGRYTRPSAQEVTERRRLAAERAAQEELDIAREQASTAAKAAAILKAASPVTAHAYLERKGVAAVPTLRAIEAGRAVEILGYTPKSNGEALTGQLLVVPVKQGTAISTLELIDEAGRKAALAGRGSKTGGYWATARLPEGDAQGVTLLIGEGVATVLTASAATGHAGVAALASGNLPAVAKAVRELYPAAALVVLADLVKATGKPDAHAVEAALAARARLAVPSFGAKREPGQTDFNDMGAACGLKAVGDAVAGASVPTAPERASGLERTPAPHQGSEVTLIRGSDVVPEPIDWLWEGYLAAGKMHILGGAPGTGKTTIAMALAATVTTGGRWPDGTDCDAGNCVVWSGEDDPSDTLVPRLTLAGADVSRVFFIADIQEGSERRAFDPARHMDDLRRKLAQIGGARLLIVDPVVSAVAGDSHKNAEVRRALQPLVDLAASMRCAVVGITHFSKGTRGRDPVERLTGSIAFGGLARIVLVAAKHQEQGEDGRTARLFCRAKSNIGPDGNGFEYELRQGELKKYPDVFSSAVVWGRAVEGPARELLATADATDDDGEGGTLADAKRFLCSLLADGPLPVKTIQVEADGAGYSRTTIRRAQKALGIEATKEGMRGGWVWRLPVAETPSPKMLKKHEDAQQKNMSTFGKFEHLRGQSGTVEVEL